MKHEVSNLPTVEITRRFKAPLARVFAAWTSATEMGRWIAPGEWQTRSARIDLRLGGEFCFEMFKGDRTIQMRGVYREVHPPRRLVFTWRQEGDPAMDFGETLVTVEFVQRDDVTELRLLHAGFKDENIRAGHSEGWAECFDYLSERLLEVPSRELV